MANAPKPSRSAGRGATKAKSRTSRSRAGSPGSVRSTVSTSKADRNPQSPVAKLHKDLIAQGIMIATPPPSQDDSKNNSKI
ncbi:hypothetical protein N7485_000085 [Penicillium canescens]|nr:hypothetical protein N7485_000085 [Penicillium canescens]